MKMTSPAARAGITVGGLGLAYGLGYIPIPGVDIEALSYLISSAGGSSLQLTQVSIVALGLLPFIGATQLVEIIALIMPRLRPLRTEGPMARARLLRWSLALTLVFAAVQAYFISVWLLGSNTSYELHHAEVIPEPGAWFHATTVLTLTAGTALLITIAHLLSHRGLGNGISLLIGWGLVMRIVDDGLVFLQEIRIGQSAPFDLVLWVLAMVALAYATVRVVGHASRLTGGALEDAEPGFGLRLPTCGIIPLTSSLYLLMIPVQLESLGLLRGIATRLTPGSIPYLVVDIVLVAGIGYLLTALFYRTQVVARFARATDSEPVRAMVWRGLMISLAFFCAVLIADHFLARHRIDPPIDVILVLTLIGLDLRTECRWLRRCPDAVKVWELHRLYAIDPILRKLENLGIAAHVRGQYHRSALYFFGPYVPVEVAVAPDDAERALECVEQELFPDEEDAG